MFDVVWSIERLIEYRIKKGLVEIGGAMRDRTADLFTASEALSQLSYSPIYNKNGIQVFDITGNKLLISKRIIFTPIFIVNSKNRFKLSAYTRSHAPRGKA